MVSQAQAVPVTLDLTAGGDAMFAGAYWATTDQQPTGTGVIKPFLRLQGTGSEIGLNSDEGQNDLLADTKAGLWTHDLVLSTVGMTTISGVTYYPFLLDINESANTPLLSLDIFQLYTRPTSITDGNQDTLAAVQAGGSLRYDLDAGTDRAVLLNYNLNSGSGSGDLYIYVPTSLFAGVAPSDYLYLYTQFGVQPGYESGAGFEEFAVTASTVTVPDSGGTILLVGLGMLILQFARRFRRA